MEVSGKRAECVTEPCEPCQVNGKSSQADGFCKDCDENMCSKCFQNHTTLKLGRNHVMSPLGQGSLDGKARASSSEKCKTHTSEYIKYYCPKHDMVTCGDCIVANHNGCKLEFINVVANKFENRSEFKDIVKTIEKLDCENNESKKRLANNRKENKAFLDKAIYEIKKFRKEINDHLDKVEKEVVSEANKRFKEIEDLMSKIEKMTSLAEQEIADLKNNHDSKIIQGEKLFICAKEYKPKLSKVAENIAYIRTNNVIKRFTFEQEKQLAGMIRSGIKLGCLRMDTAPEEAPAVVQKTQQSVEPMNEVLKRKAEKHVEAKQKFLPPDPRAAGFDVGSRVEHIHPGIDVIDDCVICMDKVENPRRLKCGHIFCADCIRQHFDIKKTCPTCGHVCGIIEGDQPDGVMKVSYSSMPLSGYPDCGQIIITYNIFSGPQKANHPNPGQVYNGIRRMAYLPDNLEGQTVLKMLRVAFDRKLVFTIGRSRTTVQEGVVTWNDIHHKTDWKSNSQFGYPDPTYLARVKDELAAKGVTEEDIE